MKDAKRLLAQDVGPSARAARVRWILALDEAGRLRRPATWAEWNKIWFRHSHYTAKGSKRAIMRLRSTLKEYGVHLGYELWKSVSANAPAIRALIEPWLHVAERLEVEIVARRAREKPQLVGFRQKAQRVRSDDVLAVIRLSEENNAEQPTHRELMRRFGISYGRLRYLLSCKNIKLDRRRPLGIEDVRQAEVVARALDVFDKGGTVRDVAQVLAPCGLATAWRFLKRHGRRSPLRDAGVATPARPPSEGRSEPA